MTALQPPGLTPPDEMDLGVVLVQTGTRQWHTGLVVRTPDGPHVVEVNWHFTLEFHPLKASEGYWWAPIALPPRRRADFVAYVVRHARTWEHAIPFSPTFTRQTIFGDGTLGPFAPGDGLTCATFVLALFRDRLDMNLLDTETWQKRDEDDAWLGEILQNLRQRAAILRHHGRAEEAAATERHIAVLASNDAVRRYRPGEACAGTLAPKPGSPPLSYIDASRLGAELEESVSLCG